MATDRTIVKIAEQASRLALPNISNPVTVTAQIHQRPLSVPLPADAAGSTVITMPLHVFDRPVSVISWRVSTTANVTSNDTNYATLSLQWDNDAGGSATVVGSFTTKTSGSGGSGNITANLSVAGPVTLANAAVPSGSGLRLAQTKTGSGVQLPVYTVHVVFEEV